MLLLIFFFSKNKVENIWLHITSAKFSNLQLFCNVNKSVLYVHENKILVQVLASSRVIDAESEKFSKYINLLLLDVKLRNNTCIINLINFWEQ